MAFVKKKHLNLYKKYIRQLISDLGEDVTLVSSTSEYCHNCLYDHSHGCSSGVYNTETGTTEFTGGVCPICNGIGKITTEDDVVIKCIINWVNYGDKEEMDEKLSIGDIEQLYCKIKTYIENYDSIKSSDRIEIDGESFRLVNIIKRGLKENVVTEAYLKRE